MPEYHALLSPSGAQKWLNCPNAIAAEIDQPEIGDGKAADLGTDKHELLAMCLSLETDARLYIGHTLGRGHKVDAEFASQVQIVVDGVRDRIKAYEDTGASVTLEVEQDVPIGHITGEECATGRADVVLLADWKGIGEVCVIDAKFGYRAVSAENNAQGMMYAFAAATKFSHLCSFRTGLIVIHQPAVSEAPVEWSVSLAELTRWARNVAAPAAARAMGIVRQAQAGAPLARDSFNPAEKQCQWCRAKAVCPALKAKVTDALGMRFDEITEATVQDSAADLTAAELGEAFPVLDLIEDWIKAVRGRIEHELLQGNEVPGTKLVAGRRGARAWASADEAEALLKSFRLTQEQMYSLSLLGPKPILEALKDQPRRVKKIETMIVQKDGKPHVAHVSDKRPALEIKPLADGFEAIDPNADLS
jgi:hypothetical protein